MNSISPNVYSYKLQAAQNQGIADKYNQVMNTSAGRFLMYKGLASLIQKHTQGSEAFDYGSGTGLSSQYLKEQGFNVVGADPSSEMLSLAQESYPDIPFYSCRDNRVMLDENSFDLVFSSLVLFELSSKDGIVSYFKEASRLLKEGGVIAIVAGAQEMYSQEGYQHFSNDYPENSNLKSGDHAKICLKTPGGHLELTDYFWLEEDYMECLEKAGFELLEVNHPLGDAQDPFDWGSESTASPYLQLVARVVK